jgi:hypothetical protein
MSVQVVKIVGDIDELENCGKHQYTCTFKSCGRKFLSSTNLSVHKIKHHESGQLEKRSAIYEFYCPVKNCQYNIEQQKSKFFSAIKNLNQHYRKVHAEKIYKCSKCEKSFATKAFLQKHLQECGFILVCNFCGYEYNTREALMTHISRKHSKKKEGGDFVKANSKKITVVFRRNKETPIPLASKFLLKQPETNSSVVTKSCQTDIFNISELLNFKKPIRRRQSQTTQTAPKVFKLCNETQTEIVSTPAKTSPNSTDVDVIEEAIATILQDRPALDFHNTSVEQAHIEESNLPEKDSLTTDNASQTLDLYGFEEHFAHCFENNQFDNGFCSIGSQTDYNNETVRSMSTATGSSTNNFTHYDRTDPMLYYSQYTQTESTEMTCDEIMDPIINPIMKNMDEFESELGLSNIQTQTNWNSDDLNDFLLVSTETQTSFSSCFFLNNQTQTQEFLAEIGGNADVSCNT